MYLGSLKYVRIYIMKTSMKYMKKGDLLHEYLCGSI